MTDATNALKLDLLLRLPWTIQVEHDEEGGENLAVVELPAVIGIGETPKERVEDLWEAMRSVLGAYLEEGVRPPLPASVARLPWEITPAPRRFISTSQVPMTPNVSMATFGPVLVFGEELAGH